MALRSVGDGITLRWKYSGKRPDVRVAKEVSKSEPALHGHHSFHLYRPPSDLTSICAAQLQASPELADVDAPRDSSSS